MISEQSGDYLVRAARAVIQDYLRHNKISKPEGYPVDLNEKNGVIVELFKKLPSSAQKELRGSGGSLSFNKPAAHACAEAAVAACGDKRFAAFSMQELPVTKIHVSVIGEEPKQIFAKSLTEYMRAFTQGQEGLIMRKGASTGILMPQIILQNKWSAVEALENLSQKTGMDKDAWKNNAAKIFTFKAQLFKE